MSTRAIASIALAGVLLAACSNQNRQSNGPSSNATMAGPVAVTNPTDFPLGAGAKILAAKPFDQTVASSGGGGTLLAHGSGTYEGHSVVAQWSGSLAGAKAWLAKTESSPPAGYKVIPQSDDPHAVAVATKFGVTYGVFEKGKKGAVIAVIDPKVAHDKLGFVIDLADKYKMLPEALRSSIDDQVKRRAGMSITDALDPSAPVGMTIEALRTINGSDKPAIVEVDATKQ